MAGGETGKINPEVAKNSVTLWQRKHDCTKGPCPKFDFCRETAFYQRALSKAGTDSKTLFRIFQDLMANYKMNPLPDVSAITNANDFNAFFVDKIRRLKERFNDDLDHKPTTVILWMQIWKSSPRSTSIISSNSYGQPQANHATWIQYLRASVTDTIANVIHKIINGSLATATVPYAYKTAIVKPLLKKQGLDLVHQTTDLYRILHSYRN